jgi:glyoxylase-like metal-dependent hydrolase (beta-lactamase superfamily II)
VTPDAAPEVGPDPGPGGGGSLEDRLAAAREAAAADPRLVPGVPSALSPLVRRVVAPNPGLMTGPGTNTYLVGIDEVAVIDPGPDDESHVRAIVGASMPDRVRWVLLTHTHPDHWPAAARIRAQTGARIAAYPRFPKADGVDVAIDRALDEGDTIDGTEFRLEALHTPGHAPNHLCFLLEEERMLFTGDHVLNGTTTVVNPQRGGDMAAYLASLERLRRLKRIARIAPAHGDVVEDPKAWLDAYVAHRKMRERQIVKLLRGGPARIPDIVRRLYPDTPEGLVDMAQRQVHAHLLKLKTEGKVDGRSVKGAWSLRA